MAWTANLNIFKEGPRMLSECTEIIKRLANISSIGEERAFCSSIRVGSLDNILPQIICIMLSSPTMSHPIYDLLKSHASQSLSFRTRLFFALKSTLGTADDSSAAFVYFLCCDLIDLSAAKRKRNTAILRRRYQLRHPERVAFLRYGHSSLRVPVFSHKHKPNRVKRRLRLARTRGTLGHKLRMPTFEGMWLFFAKAISSIVSPPLFNEFNDFLKIFLSKKNFRNLSIGNSPKSRLKQNVQFFTSLIDVSTRLKKLPISLRQRALEVDLSLLNMKTVDKISDPFNDRKAIMNILADEVVLLDSADNVPFMVFAEVVGRSVPVQHTRSEIYCRARVLWGHLNSLSELGEVGDVNGIRENILEALEQMLLADQPSVNYKIGNQAANWPASQESKTTSLAKDEPVARLIEGPEDELVHGCQLADQHGQIFDPYDPHAQPLLIPERRRWDILKDRVSKISPLASLPGWDLTSFVVKSGSSLKFEYLAYQIISEMKRIFIENSLQIYLKDYQIYLISETAGFVETVRDTLSVHKIKSEYGTLLEYFKTNFTESAAARRNFISSLVGYSLTSFLLQLKDRHNGNILIDGFGHIIHVDFAFIFGKHPGFYSVENAPFKFSDEYLELVDLDEFRQLFHSGFVALSANIERIALLVEIVEKQGLCDVGTASLLRARMCGGETDEAVLAYCKGLTDKSIRNMRTMVYDRFQYFSNGYY